MPMIVKQMVNTIYIKKEVVDAGSERCGLSSYRELQKPSGQECSYLTEAF